MFRKIRKLFSFGGNMPTDMRDKYKLEIVPISESHSGKTCRAKDSSGTTVIKLNKLCRRKQEIMTAK